MASNVLCMQRFTHPCLQRLGLTGRVQRPVCQPLCAKQKNKAANVKVNKRGKVTSRPGPGSKMLQEAQQQMLQQAQGVAPADVAQPAAEQEPQQQQQRHQEQQQQNNQQTVAAASQPTSKQTTVAETPQVVVDRMFRRVLTFAGLPVFAGLVLFPVFWYLRVVQKVEYPLWVVYVTQAFMFGGGLLGITYGILSSSWDPRREGSALGWTELQANLPILLNRNKDQRQ